MSKVSISMAWEESKRVLVHDGRLLVAVALALFVLPGLVLDLSVPDAPTGKLPPAGPWVIVAVIALCVSLIGQLAVVRLAMGPQITVGEAIGHGARRLLPYLASVLMWMLPLLIVGALLINLQSADPATPRLGPALGLMLVAGVMLFVAVRLMLSSAIAGAEPIGPAAIIGRSWHLTRGNWWRMFGFFVAFIIGAVVLFGAVQAVFGLMANMIFDGSQRGGLAWFLVRVVSQLISAAVSVVFFVMLARIYGQLAGRGEAQRSVPNSGI